MKRRWKPWLYIAGVLCMSISCKTNDRTTMVFGTVKNEINQPIEGVPVALFGEKGILGSQNRELTRTKTDKQGAYSLATGVSKDYHSADVYNLSHQDTILWKLYTEGPIYINDQQTKDCCRVPIGQKTKFDFVLIRK